MTISKSVRKGWIYHTFLEGEFKRSLRFLLYHQSVVWQAGLTNHHCHNNRQMKITFSQRGSWTSLACCNNHILVILCPASLTLTFEKQQVFWCAKEAASTLPILMMFFYPIEMQVPALKVFKSEYKDAEGSNQVWHSFFQYSTHLLKRRKGAGLPGF